MTVDPAAGCVLAARWIFPVAEQGRDAEPIRDGAIEIGPAGGIVAVHRGRPAGARDLGDVALLPALVNAHAHLEFSHLAEPFQPANPFSDWMNALIQERRSRAVSRVESARIGVRECQAAGTGWIGEMLTTDDLGDYEAELAASAVLFRELIAFPPEQVDERIDAARRFLERAKRFGRPCLPAGLSPHAPYSVHPRLLEQAVELCREHQTPLTMHLAETPAEIEFLATQTGPFRRALEGWGLWRPNVVEPGTRPLHYLQRLERAPRVLIAHGNYLDDEEIDWLATRDQFSVNYCPRTHAFFGHPPHPWRKMLSRGVRVALGTDGRCSNPDLDLFGELRFLRQNFPDVDPRQLVRMATRAGAEALGIAERCGTLEAGKSSRLAIVRLARVTNDAYRDLFDARAAMSSWPN